MIKGEFGMETNGCAGVSSGLLIENDAQMAQQGPELNITNNDCKDELENLLNTNCGPSLANTSKVSKPIV